TFKTLCLLNYALMIRHDYDITSSLRRGALQLWYQSQIHEEFRTSSGPSDAGGNPPPVTIHTWLERFNKQKPHSFEKAAALVDVENWISHMEKIFDFMGCEDAFKTRLATNTETSTEFMQRFLRLAGFLGAAAGTEEEQAKNFQWGLRRNSDYGRDQRNRDQQSNRSAISGNSS
nr:zinc finger, CCHC-type, retrotransposon Gag domain protein [Tanacetum cinerariifolium]